MSQLLISVTSVQEAEIALRQAADIIDLKNPAEGALGALPLASVVEIVRYVNTSSGAQKKITSATIGDLPMEPELLLNQVSRLGSSGVDIIKIGFFMGSDDQPVDYQSCLDALTSVTKKGIALVAVLFAEYIYPADVLSAISQSGFTGIMFDTFQKNGKTILDYHPIEELKKIAGDVQHAGMRFGLAGSLNIEHLARIKVIRPDYIGFRGGVCYQHARTDTLDADRIRAIRAML